MSRIYSVIANVFIALLRMMPPRKEKAAVSQVSGQIDESTKVELTLTVNPVVRNLRGQELGKALLGYAIPVTGLLVPFAITSSHVLFPIIMIGLCIGLVCLWNGMLLRGIIPDKMASTLELFGALSIFFAFFAVIGSFLPPGVAWIIWVCFLACIVPLPMSFLQVKEMTLIDRESIV